MSKTYKASNAKRNSWLTRQWYKWLEVFTIRTLLPIALFYLLRNFIRFMKQRSVVKKTLLSSQELVDELDRNGFYLDIVNFYFFKFRTYALDNIQIITEQVNSTDNMHQETLTRIIVSNINEILKERGGQISNNTSMRILQPSDKVLLIRLHPISMAATIISLKDTIISLIISGLAIMSYFLIF